jgi:ubiquinol-cytochrome c reductase cytochrome c subunit
MRRWLLLLSLGALLTACGYGSEPNPYTAPALSEGVTNGAVLFERTCAWCHGSQGQGTSRGPNLNGELDGGAYTDFMLSSGRMPLASPSKKTPAPISLDRQQIDALVAHVETLGGSGPTVPRPDPASGDVSAGAELYLSNCAACHSSTGAGGALTSGTAAPPLIHHIVTPTLVAEAMLVGPGCQNTDPTCGPGSGAMPIFAFSSQEVNDITAYVMQLRHGSEGGWSVGRIGPVGEGAIGWVIGMGAMLLAIRWIGTRVGEEK